MRPLRWGRFRCLACGLVVAGVIAAMAHAAMERRQLATRPDESDDGVQPADLRTLWLSDNLTAVDGGPVRWSGWRDGGGLN